MACFRAWRVRHAAFRRRDSRRGGCFRRVGRQLAFSPMPIRSKRPTARSRAQLRPPRRGAMVRDGRSCSGVVAGWTVTRFPRRAAHCVRQTILRHARSRRNTIGALFVASGYPPPAPALSFLRHPTPLAGSRCSFSCAIRLPLRGAGRMALVMQLSSAFLALHPRKRHQRRSALQRRRRSGRDCGPAQAPPPRRPERSEDQP